MAYIRNTLPNEVGIQHSTIKQDWISVRHELHEALSESYYNTVVHGIPTNVVVYGVTARAQGTDLIMDSLPKFQEYQEVLFHLDHGLMFLINGQLPVPLPRDEFDAIIDFDGNITGYKSDEAKVFLNAWRAAATYNRLISNALFNRLEQQVLNDKGRAIDISQWLSS